MSGLLVAVLLAFASAGVPAEAGAQPEAPPEVRPAERQGAVTSGGSFYVEWWPDPAPVPLDELFEIHFRVLEPGDRATLVTGAAVTAGAWMPAHNHGSPLVPRIEPHGDGTFTGHGFLLQMEGHWELRVSVAAEGRLERAVFDVELGVP